MSNSFIMTESIVRPAKMPYGRLKDNGFVGIEGEHAARALVVETKDDLSAFASVNLIIDDLDCGAMTKTTSGNTTTLSMTLTSSMIGRSGRKICQLIMVNSGNTVVQKSSQFEAYVGRANEIERSVDDGVTIIILSEAVTEMAREAAAAAAEEAVADVVEDCQAIADAASASADAAAQSASDAQTAAASIVVDSTLDTASTNAVQNKVVASEIAGLKADLDALDPGLSDDAKEALMACFAHVTWDEDSSSYMDNLRTALEIVANPFEDAEYEIGALGFNAKADRSSGCVTKNDALTTRVRTVVPVSCRHGRLTAKTGYEINRYMLNGTSYGEWSNTSGVSIIGYYDLAYIGTEYYQWGTEKEILTGTKYCLVVVRKTSGDAFTQQEAENIYGTGFEYEEATS